MSKEIFNAQTPLNVNSMNNLVQHSDDTVFEAGGKIIKTAAGYKSSGGIATKFDLLAPLASPAFTETPTAPTAAQSVNNNQVATTGYVRQAISDVKNITEAAFTGMVAGSVKRQANFVIGWLKGYASHSSSNGYMGEYIYGIIPVGFRPNVDTYIGVVGVEFKITGLEYYKAFVHPDGKIIVKTFSNSSITVDAVFGYEIT